MSSVDPQEMLGIWEPPASKPLDERVWQAWIAKGRAQEGRRGATRITAVKWITLAGISLAALGELWPYFTQFDVGLRFLIAAGAIALSFHAFHHRNYASGALFGAIALLYNPLAPVFSFSGQWQRVLMMTSAIPVVASLTSPRGRN